MRSVSRQQGVCVIEGREGSLGEKKITIPLATSEWKALVPQTDFSKLAGATGSRSLRLTHPFWP